MLSSDNKNDQNCFTIKTLYLLILLILFLYWKINRQKITHTCPFSEKENKSAVFTEFGFTYRCNCINKDVQICNMYNITCHDINIGNIDSLTFLLGAPYFTRVENSYRLFKRYAPESRRAVTKRTIIWVKDSAVALRHFYNLFKIRHYCEQKFPQMQQVLIC